MWNVGACGCARWCVFACVFLCVGMGACAVGARRPCGLDGCPCTDDDVTDITDMSSVVSVKKLPTRRSPAHGYTALLARLFLNPPSRSK